MPNVLLCAQRSLEEELRGSVLFRRAVARHSARSLEQALLMALAARPELVLIDRDLPRSDELVTRLRADSATRACSIAVVARGELQVGEVAMMQAGANALLRLPADGDWDQRLVQLLSVPLRRDARLPVHLRLSDPLRAGADAIGLGLNLSAHGMLVEVTERLRLHERIAFAFRLRADDADRVSGIARVVREAGASRFGVEFERLDYAGAARIQRYVATLPA